MSRVAAPAVLLVVAGLLAAQPAPPGKSEWLFDEITLTNGAKFQGLLLEENSREVRFQSVSRPPGKPTITLTSRFPRSQIADIKKLRPAERAVLKERLAELDRDGSGERARMEAVDLTDAMWLGKPAAALRYDSNYFAIVSDASEEVIRRAAVRLEQIYSAFAHVLPPTVPDARPTIVMLAPDSAAYKLLLTPLGQTNLLNPAVYDPRANLIVCGSELRTLGTELQAAKFHHSQQLAKLERYTDNIRKLYRAQELERHLEPIARERRRVHKADYENMVKFDTATKRLFAILYHEAFHAYVTTFVYPPETVENIKAGKGTGELPRWLNEGLAQIFETAVVEAGELRADHADRERLILAQDLLRKKDGPGLVPLGELLVAGRDTFLAKHADDRAPADRAYLTSWALAHYLTFDQRLLGTERFRKYLAAINTGTDPRLAFETLVEKKLNEFEKAWHTYVMKLQVDGSLVK